MFHRIRTFSNRTLAAVAAAAVLAGAATATAAPAEQGSRVQAEAASMQTSYLYFSDNTYTEIVGHATSGCGEPYTLHFGVVTQYVRIGEAHCPY